MRGTCVARRVADQGFLAAGAAAAAGFAAALSLATRKLISAIMLSVFRLSLFRRYLPATTSAGVPLICMAMIWLSAWRIFRSTLKDFEAATKFSGFTPATR